MISVALCTYNGERHIEQQIRSILVQTTPVDEIVVCDDGSIDQTVSIVEKIKTSTNVNIRIHINPSSLGVCGNFEKAIKLCEGDIVFLSDQDDFWYKDKVEKICDYFQRNQKKSVVFTNADLVDVDGNNLGITAFDCYGLDEVGIKRFDADPLLVYFCGNRALGCSIAFRSSTKSWILPLVNDDPIYLHDDQIAIKAIERHQLGHIDERLFAYRQHSNQERGLLAWAKIHPKTDVIHINEFDVLPHFTKYLSDDRNIKRIEFFHKRFSLPHNATAFKGKVKSITLIMLHIPEYLKYCKLNFYKYIYLDTKRVLHK